MRYDKRVVIDATGRDQGKIFLLTEMPTQQGEEWAIRLLCGLAKSGVELPDGWQELPWAALASLGVKALLQMPFFEMKPLLDEMMDCVKIIVDPSKPEATTRTLIPDDIDEIATRLTLRKEVFQLHTGFSQGADPSISAAHLLKTMTSDSKVT